MDIRYRYKGSRAYSSYPALITFSGRISNRYRSYRYVVQNDDHAKQMVQYLHQKITYMNAAKLAYDLYRSQMYTQLYAQKVHSAEQAPIKYQEAQEKARTTQEGYLAILPPYKEAKQKVETLQGVLNELKSRENPLIQAKNLIESPEIDVRNLREEYDAHAHYSDQIPDLEAATQELEQLNYQWNIASSYEDRKRKF